MLRMRDNRLEMTQFTLFFRLPLFVLVVELKSVEIWGQRIFISTRDTVAETLLYIKNVYAQKARLLSMWLNGKPGHVYLYLSNWKI